MPKIAREVSEVAIRRLTLPGRHAVGGVPGLHLDVSPTGSRSWVLRFSLAGRRRDMGLGPYPEVSLRAARESARKARQDVREGLDPIASREAARRAALAAAGRRATFREAAETFIAAHEASWANPKHRRQWRSTLEAYAYPVIGPLAVGDVGLAHVLKILEPLWSTKTETAKRLRGRIEQVLDAAQARGLIDGPWQNPARWRGHLDKLLARPSRVAKVTHHPALPIDEVAGFMVRLRAAEGMGARALEFAILTAARSGEVRGATWAEIDLAAKVWTIPAERMKAGKEHRVPLSDAALALLAKVPRMGGTDLVFPAARGGALSDMTLSAVTRRLDVAAVPHGFRSTFRDWSAERTSYPSEVCEMALAHTVGNKVEAAYRRGDMFERRRRLMAEWAAFLAKPVPKGNVTSIRGAA
ncbi:MAG: integrase arm-type DNA-binding domain-containing protein [Caulobacteraceae bacterium]|nr:integrase arm-type DNA-binding domain-containing protein [Caulobacteraceae bacterium]